MINLSLAEVIKKSVELIRQARAKQGHKEIGKNDKKRTDEE